MPLSPALKDLTLRLLEFDNDAFARQTDPSDSGSLGFFDDHFGGVGRRMIRLGVTKELFHGKQAFYDDWLRSLRTYHETPDGDKNMNETIQQIEALNNTYMPDPGAPSAGVGDGMAP